MDKENVAPDTADQQARDRIRTSLDESLVVEAAAGTGKTSELVRRIVAILRTGRATVDALVAVTFTRKAAGELKLRLRQQLDRARLTNEDPEECRRLEDAMVRLEEAHIGTIHSFCADILRERPVEAGIQPGFEELDESQAAQLFERVFSRWAQDAMKDPPPGLRRALGRVSEWDGSRPPLERIRREAWKIIEWRDFPSPWRREAFGREGAIDALLEDARKVAEMAAGCGAVKDALRQALGPVLDFSDRLGRQEAVRGRDYDDLEASLVGLPSLLRRNMRKGRGKFSDQHSRQEVLGAREELLAGLDRFRLAADADLAASLREELWGLVAAYDDAKLAAGKLDFVDLLISARNLIRDNRPVRNHLQSRFSRIFVDEFQDTDPLQAEILLLLASDDPALTDRRIATPVRGKLFLVGDPKQSIYRFRRADFALYRSLREGLVSRGVGLVYLTRSFRAVPDIQRAVNYAFAAGMREDPAAGQPAYVPLGEEAAPIAGQPALIALPVPRPYGSSRVARSAVAASLPDTVAAWIDWLLGESGWRVREPGSPSHLVPVAPRHVAVLFRRFLSWGEDVTRDYVHALETRSIPHLLWGARSFHRREEVETLRAALAAVEWPDDELSVFAALRGSLFAIPDDVLLRYREQVGPLHPFRQPPPEMDPDAGMVQDALALLSDLHRGRNRRPFVETVNRLLGATRAHAGFALRPAGNQVLANVYRVGDLARRFETQGGTSFRGFVEQLIREAASEDQAESPVPEEGADGVRVMTVHAAKGLEFPVVLLADITANLASAAPDKHVDPERGLAAMRLLGCSPWELDDHRDQEHSRDRSEGVRVAYVAATRARDLLVVPTLGDGPIEGWAAALNEALYPPGDQARNSLPAAGCPEFGGRSVLERPAHLMSGEETSVRPGLHRPGTGAFDVVWWDPSRLTLDQPANFGILQGHILTGDGADAAGSTVLYQQWREDREASRRAGSTKRIDVFSPSEPDAPACAAEASVDVETLRREPGRPAGPRFGTLVHLLLRDAAFGPAPPVLDALAQFHGRILDAPPEERAAAVDAVRRALDHPLLRRARRAERRHTEYPVTLDVGDRRKSRDERILMEGVIDLLFEEDGVWQVVDFKTDSDIERKLGDYRSQIGWYMRAVSEITRQPARGYLLGV